MLGWIGVGGIRWWDEGSVSVRLWCKLNLGRIWAFIQVTGCHLALEVWPLRSRVGLE